ncbi:hypothetical protein E2C01_028040 [Portunus trituberculatus]|uniref:Uncharacterized protein n=1 Tax=Portunus trituberculatus TaxID=210409 RepID=A0A5B7EP02_PORTR|nr:hypothetical protein [Portunus trituberculatus]
MTPKRRWIRVLVWAARSSAPRLNGPLQGLAALRRASPGPHCITCAADGAADIVVGAAVRPPAVQLGSLSRLWLRRGTVPPARLRSHVLVMQCTVLLADEHLRRIMVWRRAEPQDRGGSPCIVCGGGARAASVPGLTRALHVLVVAAR